MFNAFDAELETRSADCFRNAGDRPRSRGDYVQHEYIDAIREERAVGVSRSSLSAGPRRIAVRRQGRVAFSKAVETREFLPTIKIVFRAFEAAPRQRHSATMSNAVQVSFPSLGRTQIAGSPNNNAFRVAGVRVRTAMTSAGLNFITLSTPSSGNRSGPSDSSDG